MVYFVESLKHAAVLIQTNLRSLGVSDRFEILRNGTVRAIGDLERRASSADFIFLDPPYAMREAYAKTLSALGDSSLSESAVVIAEHEKQFDPGEKFGSLQRFRTLLQGDSGLSFYRRAG